MALGKSYKVRGLLYEGWTVNADYPDDLSSIKEKIKLAKEFHILKSPEGKVQNVYESDSMYNVYDAIRKADTIFIVTIPTNLYSAVALRFAIRDLYPAKNVRIRFYDSSNTLENNMTKHTEAQLMIFIGISHYMLAKLSKISIPIVLIDSNPMSSQSTPGVLVLLQAVSSVKYSEPLSYGTYVYYIIEYMYSAENRALSDYVVVLSALAILSDGYPKHPESELIIKNAISIIRQHAKTHNPLNPHNLTWLIELSYALQIDLTRITVEELMYDFVPVLTTPMRYRLHTVAVLLLSPHEFKDKTIEQKSFTNYIMDKINEAIFHQNYFQDRFLKVILDKKTNTIDPNIYYTLVLLKSYMSKDMVSKLPYEIQNVPDIQRYELPFYMQHKTRQKDNQSQLRLLYTFIKILHNIRKSYVKDFENLINRSHHKYSHGYLVSLLKRYQSISRVITDAGLLIIKVPDLPIDIHTSLAYKISEIENKPFLLIIHKGNNTVELVMAYFDFPKIINIIEEIIKDTEYSKQIINFTVEGKYVRLSCYNDITILEYIISVLDDRMSTVISPYLHVPEKYRNVYYVMANRSHLDNIELALEETGFAYHDDNLFFVTFENTCIVSIRHYIDDEKGIDALNCYLHVPVSLEAQKAINDYQRFIQENYNTTMATHHMFGPEIKEFHEVLNSDNFSTIKSNMNRSLYDKITRSPEYPKITKFTYQIAKNIINEKPWTFWPLYIFTKPIVTISKAKNISTRIYDLIYREKLAAARPSDSQGFFMVTLSSLSS